MDCTVITGGIPKLGLDIAENPLEVRKVKTQAARNAGIRVGDYLVRVGGREVKTGQDVLDAVRETSENGEIRCRFLRRHVEGEDTWIDIAKNREVWTDLVYELFHNAIRLLREWNVRPSCPSICFSKHRAQWIHVISWMIIHHILVTYDGTTFDSTLHTYDGSE